MTTAFELADRFVDELCEIHPTLATYLGIPGHNHEWGDSFGLTGIEAAHDLMSRYQAEMLPHVEDSDPRQRLAARVAMGSIGESLSRYEAGDHFLDLRHIGSSFHEMRSVFDIAPATTAEDWEDITVRLETIDQPFEDYRSLLDEGRARGLAVARRQVESVMRQSRDLAGEESAFNTVVTKASAAGHHSDRLEGAVDHARETVGAFAEWLEAVYLPSAVEADGCGEDYYRRAADRLVGLAVDPHEAYQWGWEEFDRLWGELGRVGDQIMPGAGVAEVKEFLESDPDGTVRSTDELVVFVENVLRQAVDDLAGTHFDVPDVIKPLTVQIAPPGGPLGVYYIRPSEDLSRAGGVWYAIGDQTVFPLYQHVSTAYHEGFPGHHLQIATAMYRKDELSRAQRVMTWYPGYGEGWAMYAEVLMGELGYLEDPRQYFGMLAKQMYRAARVVVDIGLHLSQPISHSSPMAPGEMWEFETAVRFMEVYGFRTPAQAEAEVLRYLGWPGQAIAYKLGEREILSIRQDAKSRLGEAFDLKDFHATVLNSGPMRLDLLREVVAGRL